jgi:hypothetical protein
MMHVSSSFVMTFGIRYHPKKTARCARIGPTATNDLHQGGGGES